MKTKLFTILIAIMTIGSLTSCQPESPQDLLGETNVVNDSITVATVTMEVISGGHSFYSYKLNTEYTGFYHNGPETSNTGVADLGIVFGNEHPNTFEFNNKYDVTISTYACLPGPWGACDLLTSADGLVYKMTITTDNPNDEPIVKYGPTETGGFGGTFKFSEQ